MKWDRRSAGRHWRPRTFKPMSALCYWLIGAVSYVLWPFSRSWLLHRLYSGYSGKRCAAATLLCRLSWMSPGVSDVPAEARAIRSTVVKRRCYHDSARMAPISPDD